MLTPFDANPFEQFRNEDVDAFMHTAWPYDPETAGLHEFANLVRVARSLSDEITYEANVTLPDHEAETLEGNCFVRSRAIWQNLCYIVPAYLTLDLSGSRSESGKALYHGGVAASLGGLPFVEIPYDAATTHFSEDRTQVTFDKYYEDPEHPLRPFAVTPNPDCLSIFENPVVGILQMHVIGEVRKYEAAGDFDGAAQILAGYPTLWPQFNVDALLDVATPLARDLSVIFDPLATREACREFITEGVSATTAELVAQAQQADPKPEQPDTPWDQREPYAGSMALVEQVLDFTDLILDNDQTFADFRAAYAPRNIPRSA